MSYVVIIDGVLYVPVSHAHIDATKIEDAVVEIWAGEGWRTEYPDALDYLRVIVDDSAEQGEGVSVPEFVASIIQTKLSPGT